MRFALLLLLPGILGAQVLFSRRVYAEHGRTYQQISEWNADGSVKALTHSPVARARGAMKLTESGASIVRPGSSAAAGREIERIPGAEYPTTTPDFISWSPGRIRRIGSPIRLLRARLLDQTLGAGRQR